MIKNIISSVVTAILVAVVVCALFVKGTSPVAGGTFNVVSNDFSGGASIGPGTPTGPVLISNMIFGSVTCTGSSTVSGVSVQNYDCAVPGVKGLTQAGLDKVYATFGSSTVAYGIYLAGAYASTTADGSFRLRIGNASASPVSPSLATVNYLIVR